MNLLGYLLFMPPAALVALGVWRGIEGIERRLSWWMGAHALIGAIFTATALRGEQNLWLLYVYVAANAALGFHTVAKTQGLIGDLAKTLRFVMPVIGVSGVLFDQGLSITQPIVLLAMVLVGGLLFLSLHTKETPILRDPRFWLAAGIFIGQGAGLLPWASAILASPEWREAHHDLLRRLWAVQNAGQLIGYALFSGVFLCRR